MARRSKTFSRRGFMRTGLGVGTALLLPNRPGSISVGSAASAHDHEPVEDYEGGRPGASSAGQENVLDVRVRPKPGAEQSIIRLPEPSAHFPAHVHLDQRELPEILRVDLVEVGG
jgi:hypothetical protein